MALTRGVRPVRDTPRRVWVKKYTVEAHARKPPKGGEGGGVDLLDSEDLEKILHQHRQEHCQAVNLRQSIRDKERSVRQRV